MQMAIAFLVYGVAIFWTLTLILGLPAILILQLLERRWTPRIRNSMLLTLLVGASYFVGGVIGWSLRPSAWSMPFRETLRAAVDAETYGHAIEHQAERIVMYPWYMAVLCSLVAATLVGLSRGFVSFERPQPR